MAVATLPGFDFKFEARYSQERFLKKILRSQQKLKATVREFPARSQKGIKTSKNSEKKIFGFGLFFLGKKDKFLYSRKQEKIAPNASVLFFGIIYFEKKEESKKTNQKKQKRKGNGRLLARSR